MQKITINLIAWRRPYYFKEVVEALEQCDGIEEYPINLFIDGGYPEKQTEQVEIFKNSSLSKLNHNIYTSEENLGCAGHAEVAFNKSFEQGCDALITLEDDTVPAKDYLLFMNWALNKFKDDRDVFSVSGYMPRFKSSHGEDEGLKDSYCRNRDFGCYGWGTWKRIYKEIDAKWFGAKSPHDTWDKPMNFHWRKDRLQVWPDVSRIQNIGREESTFSHKDIKQHVDFWAENHSDTKTYSDFIYKE